MEILMAADIWDGSERQVFIYIIFILCIRQSEQTGGRYSVCH